MTELTPLQTGEMADAKMLERNVRAFWSRLGYKIRSRVEPIMSTSGKLFEVKADLKNGLPRDFRQADMAKLIEIYQGKPQ